jgi:hypothetical protein
MPVEQREQVTHIRWSQRETGGTPYLDGRRQPSLGGTSRMNREVHVRICGRPGVRFPGPTRQFPGPTRPGVSRVVVVHIHLVRAGLPVYFDAARIRFPLSVTEPVSAKTRPVILAPVVTVSLMNARMLPSKAVLVPRVAELVTCQNTFPAVAPLARTTEELLAVVSVLPILKT